MKVDFSKVSINATVEGDPVVIDLTKEVGNLGSPDKPGGLSIQLCKSEKKEFYIRYSS